jgi:tRNA G10  N-methylase Trm11
MQTSIAILGRQPAISRAELEAVFGSKAIKPISDVAIELSVAPEQFSIEHFGGTMKSAKVLTYLETVKWPELVDYVCRTLPDHLAYIPEGKIKLGLSAYSLPVSSHDLNKSGLRLKKVIKAKGRSVRVVPNTDPDLNSAQVLHNQLTSPVGIELLFIRDGQRTILAQTIGVQDITSYTVRDRGRPKRDAKVGMLPPKLAQVIINLAVADSPAPQTVLDPFCGTGVILLESLLMGHKAYGTDVDKRMVSYATENIDWLEHRFQIDQPAKTEVGDARKYEWGPFDVVAAETYLGEPLSAAPSHAHLEEIVRGVDQLHREALENLAKQLKPKQRLCLAVPAWRLKVRFKHLPCLDDLEKLGYTRLSFAHASNEELIYYREEQFVARELVVLIKN